MKSQTGKKQTVFENFRYKWDHPKIFGKKSNKKKTSKNVEQNSPLDPTPTQARVEAAKAPRLPDRREVGKSGGGWVDELS